MDDTHQHFDVVKTVDDQYILILTNSNSTEPAADRTIFCLICAEIKREISSPQHRSLLSRFPMN